MGGGFALARKENACRLLNFDFTSSRGSRHSQGFAGDGLVRPMPSPEKCADAPALDVVAFDAEKLDRSSRSDGHPRRHVAGHIRSPVRPWERAGFKLSWAVVSLRRERRTPVGFSKQ